MDRYLIESPHTTEDCERAVKEIHAANIYRPYKGRRREWLSS